MGTRYKPDWRNMPVHPVRVAREKLNMTRQQFAAAMGVDASTISHMETGGQAFLTRRWCRLLEVLGIDPEVLQADIDAWFKTPPGPAPLAAKPLEPKAERMSPEQLQELAEVTEGIARGWYRISHGYRKLSELVGAS